MMISLAIEIDIRAAMYSDLFLLLLVVVSSSFCEYFQWWLCTFLNIIFYSTILETGYWIV